LILVQI